MILLLSSLIPAGLLLLPAVGAADPSIDKEQEVKKILDRMTTDTLAFRDHMEFVYGTRCSTDTLTKCAYSNYNDCTSVFPNQICMDPNELIMSECGTGEQCNALWDKSVSTVTFPAALAEGDNDNPTDPELIETACYTRQAEEYMAQQYKENEVFWSQYGVSPSWTYFGAHNGMFRQIPATHQQNCGTYDPRRRPWFVAASSGPKDVVIVIDVSGSMSDYGRLGLAKEAAITIIDTLTVADRVAVVPFSTDAYILDHTKLIRATKENKDALINAVENLKAVGSTNFHAAFSQAFDALDTTISQESTTGCNIAILFLTDGQITDGPDADSVITLVNVKTTQLSSKYGRKAVIFAFSLGVNADTRVPKEIACSTGGIWSPVDDLAFGGDLVSAMSSYYKLFAVGLGEGDNSDFTAWVEPYKFFTEGKMGTTVSAPVFDRSVSPPLFLGVVAIDSLMDAFEQVLGQDATSSSMLERFILLSTASCPRLNLTECELDALRFLGSEQATCGKCTSGYAGIVPQECRGVSDLPRDLWANTDLDGLEYHERACCEVGTSEPSDECPDGQRSSLSTGAVVGISVGSIALAVLGVFFFLYYYKGKKNREGTHGTSSKNDNKASANANQNVASAAQKEPEVVVASVVTGSGTAYDGVHVAMPPTINPGFVEK